MAYSRPELFQHFEQEGYSETQVIQALSKLAEIDSSLNPSANEFDESIVEQMEDVFTLIQDAFVLARAEGIASNKQLTGTSDLTQIEQTAINLANDRSIALDVDAIKGLIGIFDAEIEILDAEAAVEAVTLFQRRKAIREGVLSQLETNSIAALNEQTAKRMDALNKLCNNPEVLDKILADYGLLPSDEASRQYVELTASCSLDFDTNAFLAEVNSEKKAENAVFSQGETPRAMGSPQVEQFSKRTLPKTVGDTQRLAKSLITRSLL
ncbi:hypothetical protein LC607_17740 [Nostoc sp. CHAB 5824]|nr:hypothetical protein [Nostoc sp. CHAB 5824]